MSTKTDDITNLRSSASERSALKALRKQVRQILTNAKVVAKQFGLVKPLREEPLLRSPEMRRRIQQAGCVELLDLKKDLHRLCGELEAEGIAKREREKEEAEAAAEAAAKEAEDVD